MRQSKIPFLLLFHVSFFILKNSYQSFYVVLVIYGSWNLIFFFSSMNFIISLILDKVGILIFFIQN